MIISVSLGNFHYWNDSFDSDSQLEYIRLVKDLGIDGIELHFDTKMLFDRGYLNYAGLLDGLVVTAHLPDTTEIESLAPNILEMKEVLGVKHFVIHSDTFEKLEKLPAYPFVIENTDFRKSVHHGLDDVAKFGEDVCVDINHIIESFPDDVIRQLSFVKGMVKEVHFSAVSNPLQEEYPYHDCPHWPVNGSDMEIPPADLLPRDVIWVIEGIIPKDRLDVLEKEIEFLRNLDS